jgi:hypothetical protein
MGRHAEALNLLKESVSLCERYDLKGVTVAPLDLALAEARLYRARGTPRYGVIEDPGLVKALKACEAAVKTGRRIPIVLPEALYLAAACHRLRGRNRTASRLWRKGMETAEMLGQSRIAAFGDL